MSEGRLGGGGPAEGLYGQALLGGCQRGGVLAHEVGQQLGDKR